MWSRKKSQAYKPRSRISAAIHKTAHGLHRIGLLNKTAMREFEASCLTAVSLYQPGKSLPSAPV
jgi:putative transcriptional regulator